MHRDREVGRDGPGGGGPDDDAEGLVSGQTEFFRFGGGDEEFDPDGDGGVFGVFDLGLGEGGFEGDAPVNGLLGAVDEVLLHEGGEGAEDIGLEGGGLGFVFVGPVGLHAEAFEGGGLFFDPALGEGIAAGAHLGGREV